MTPKSMLTYLLKISENINPQNSLYEHVSSFIHNGPRLGITQALSTGKQLHMSWYDYVNQNPTNLLPHATLWRMSLKAITVSARRQMQGVDVI